MKKGEKYELRSEEKYRTFFFYFFFFFFFFFCKYKWIRSRKRSLRYRTEKECSLVVL